MIDTNSPAKILIFTPRNAGTSSFPERYIFHKFSVLSIGSNQRSHAVRQCPEDNHILVGFSRSA